MPATKYLGLRAFIEGIEVPIVQAIAKTSIMGHATCQLVLPSTDAAKKILPRSVVHVFYYDGEKKAEVYAGKVSSSTEGSTDMLKDTSLEITNPQRWKLLFAGEFVSFAYTKQVSRRNLVLNCKGFTKYWDDAKIYYGNRGTSNRHFQQVIHMGAARVQRGKDRVNSSSDLIRLLQGKPATAPTLRGLLGGLVHLLESISGVYDRKAAERFRGVSDFMSQAELRLHLTKMLGAAGQDTSSKNFLDSAEFRRYIRRLSKSIRNTASYGQLVRILLDRVFHIYSPQLCPTYIPAGRKAKYLKLVPTNRRMPKEAKELKKKLVDALDAVEAAVGDRRETVTKRSAGGSDPYQYKAEALSPTVNDIEGQSSWKKKWDGKVPESSAIKKIKDDIERLDDGGKLTKAMRQNLLSFSKHVDDAVAKTKSKLMYEPKKEIPFFGRFEAAAAAAGINDFPEHNEKNFADTALDIQKARIAQKKVAPQRYKTVESTLTLSDRLMATTFNPLIWMCPPPKCNVLFPNQYTMFSYNRNFEAELTRLWLHGVYRSGKANYNQSYFSPNLDIVFGGMGTKSVAKAATQALSFLLPHEKYTGIVPSIQSIGYASVLKKLNKQVETAAGEKRPITNIGSKNPALARAANAKFLQGRFQSRTGSVQGPFNPNLACGMPAVVLDPTVSSTKLGSGSVVGGTHYLGMINSITHSISQSGAVTAFSMAYCRAHNEGLELFGDKNGATVTVEKTVVSGPGRKVRTSKGKEILAEVYRWELRSKRIKENGKWINVPDFVPIIGMLGIQGRVGKHVTAGLAIQNDTKGANDANNTLISGGKAVGRAVAGSPTAEKKKFANNFTDGSAFKHEHRMAPKKFNHNDSLKLDSSFGPHAVATPVSITKDETYISGRKYFRKKPWMNSKAVGAVVIDAWQGTRTKSVSKKIPFTFTFEQIARPPWLGPIYLNPEIGPKFYQELLLCGSIVDPTLVGVTNKKFLKAESTGIEDEGTGIRKVSKDEADKLRKLAQDPKLVRDRNEAMRVINDLLDQRDVDPLQKVVVTVDNGEQYVVPAKALGGKPIETACEELATTYVELNSTGSDMEIFTDTFTSRGHASLVDMFGYGFKPGKVRSDGTRSGVLGAFAVRPFEKYDPGGEMTNQSDEAKDGFHSRAFGPFNNLAMLDHEPLVDAQGRTLRDLDSSIDPRAERYQRVLDYRDSLLVSGTHI